VAVWGTPFINKINGRIARPNGDCVMAGSSGSVKQRAEAEPTTFSDVFIDSDDLVPRLARELCDPLRPLLAVHLSSAAKGLRLPMLAALSDLRRQHAEAEAMAAAWEPSLATLFLGDNPLGAAGLQALLPAVRELPAIKHLFLNRTNMTDEGVACLLEHHTAGVLKSLEFLDLDDNLITDAGCAMLASALRAGALPALETIDLEGNPSSEEALGEVQAALGSIIVPL